MHRSHKGIWFLILDGCLILLAFLLTKGCPQTVHAETPVSLPVLMYHSIALGTESDYRIQPETFAADLSYLNNAGYTSVSAAELIRYVNGMGDLPEQPILLTFDDGFYNNYSLALPLLEQYDMCAIVSVVGQFTDELAPESPHEASRPISWAWWFTRCREDSSGISSPPSFFLFLLR